MYYYLWNHIFNEYITMLLVKRNFNLVFIYTHFFLSLSYIKNLFQSTVSLISNSFLFKHRKALSKAKQKLGILITHFAYKGFFFFILQLKQIQIFIYNLRKIVECKYDIPLSRLRLRNIYFSLSEKRIK